MEINEKDIKKFSLILLVVALAVLTFLIVKPIIISILGGLILAYVFFPVYKFLTKFVKYEWLAAGIVSIIALALIFVPLWFLTPMVVQQTFQLFQTTQDLDIRGLIVKILPTASEQLISQIDITLNNALGKITTSVLNKLVDFLVNFTTVALQLLLVAFVFFFALKDESKFREFISGLSPLNKIQEVKLVQQFKDMTSSIINGHVIAGILQGILAGVGFLVFGVPNALVLTVIAIIFGVIPLIGVGLIYIPVTIYLFVQGQQQLALIYLIYNLLFVSSLEHFIKTFFISKKTKISQVIVLIGMVGGFFLFGILGLILGPLILAYFITFLKAYKERTLSSLFASE